MVEDAGQRARRATVSELAQTDGSRRRRTEPARATGERGEPLFELDLHPLAPGRLGTAGGDADERGTDTAPSVIGATFVSITNA
jgi:hypothetical protein